LREGKARLNKLYRNEKLCAFLTRSHSRLIWDVGVEWESAVALYRYASLNDGETF